MTRDFAPGSPFALLSDTETAAWYAYMKVHLRLEYELNRQLRADSGISLADYHVLVALTSASGGRMRVTDLAIRIGWERSRLSHHLKRMRDRGLVETGTAADDRRVTEVVLSEAGRESLRQAAPDHVGFVRQAFLDALEPGELAQLTTLLDRVYDTLVEHGTLPRPEDHP
ncbi:MarR family transcriptional regulator [Amycolatopsis mediterranei S699]|uniref:MarR family transcriptional regulator n=2 Tax=Amycolatopsis mediterranei TaxID=33910 RepID=A0A0H3DBQ4_AMYMU|nr:MarR family winged helix-turn-helix transcriptional regulator [Amycolatopsis mediterranei]ADJ48400.1 MarR family transcriptional regulator [Amycolatopsis mediterranei U32]AEK45321.1 MarR family transcriptional regulator [Amycolatopsis mediterranei S699]AFO80111.1 MarR family transcriptional regulator [Amycolatopsis mediterranei S699]AGT87239.1 MarR family transcriptional regulator [Amycolatopsis mediterranei RB]KDO10918.1 MarR family transcriptional regulator [Amycolatopsis mediterranei]